MAKDGCEESVDGMIVVDETGAELPHWDGPVLGVMARPARRGDDIDVKAARRMTPNEWESKLGFGYGLYAESDDL